MYAKLALLSGLTVLTGALSYLSPLILTWAGSSAQLLGELALATMLFAAGQTVLCYGAPGYIVYFSQANNDYRGSFRQILFPVVANIVVFSMLSFAYVRFQRQDAGLAASDLVFLVVIALLGVMSISISTCRYIRDEPLHAMLAEKAGAFSGFVAALLVAAGMRAGSLYQDYAVLCVVVLGVAAVALSRSKSAETASQPFRGRQPSANNRRYLLYVHINTICAYGYLYLDQAALAANFGIESLGKYFVVIQFLNLLKFLPTQLSKFILRELSKRPMSPALFFKGAVAYVSMFALAGIAATAVLYLTPNSEVGDVLRRHWSSLIAIGFVTCLGVFYNQVLLAVGEARSLMWVNVSVFSANLLGVIVFSATHVDDPIGYLIGLKLVIGVAGQAMLCFAISRANPVFWAWGSKIYLLSGLVVIGAHFLFESLQMLIVIVLLIAVLVFHFGPVRSSRLVDAN